MTAEAPSISPLPLPPSLASDDLKTAVQLAQAYPRSIDKAIAAMKQSCSRQSVAADAFYCVFRDGETRIGPTVFLAREIATAWGRFEFGTYERRRDDTYSDMVAFAYDLESMSRNSAGILVPHEGRTGRELLEMNAAAIALRQREAIFAVLPAWYVKEAEDLCRQTLARPFDTKLTGLTPDVQPAMDDLKVIMMRHGIAWPRVEKVFGKESARFTPMDWAQLQIRLNSLERGDIKPTELFPVIEAHQLASDLLAEGKKTAERKAKKEAKNESKGAPKNVVAQDAAKTPGENEVPGGGKKELPADAGGTKEGADGAPKGDKAPGGDDKPAHEGGDQTATSDGAASSDGSGTGKRRPDGPKPPPSIAGVASSQSRQAKEEGAKAGTKQQAELEAANAKKAAKAAEKRLDKSGEPDPNEDAEAFLLHWQKRLRVVPAENEALAEAMDKHVRTKLKDLKGLQKKWGEALAARTKRLAELAKQQPAAGTA